MNVLTVGQKIKKIRKDLSLPYHRVTQAELANGKFHKSIISDLENEKMKINFHLARVIIDNAYEIAKKRGIEVSYTMEWLLEDREQEVYNLIKKHIIEIKLNFEEFESIKFKIDFLCKKEKVKGNQLFVVYDSYAKHYEKSNINIAKSYLLKMYEIACKADNISQQLYVIKRITYIYSLLNKWEDIITWGKVAISLSHKKYIKLFIKKIYFNMAIAYKFTNQFQECNYYLQLIEQKYELKENEKIDINILKADCFKEISDFGSANKIFDFLLKALQNVDDQYRIAMIYTNIADLKYNENDIYAIEFIEKALKIDLPNDLKFKFKKSQMLYIALKIYTSFKIDFKKISKILEQLCKTVILTEEYYLEIKAINLIYNYALIENNETMLKKLLIKLSNIKTNDSKKSILYFKILNYFYTHNDKNFNNELLNGFKLANEVEI